MSSQTRNERQSLESLQLEYRRAWHCFQLETSLLSTVLNNPSHPPADDEESLEIVRARADRAAEDYREARNALAAFLLEEDALAGCAECPEGAEDLARSQAA